MKLISASNSARTQSGVTLIEVLVTVIIISVGLLGVAALHVTSLRNGYESNVRSKAVWFANDIIERMRANRIAARAGAYNVTLGNTLTPGTVAGDDVNAWHDALGNTTSGIPAGQGSITTTPVGTNIIFTISIQWTERDGNHTFVTQTEI